VETSLCQPIQQFLMPGSEGRSWPEWQTPSQVAALCTASGASLWDGLAAAPDRPGNLPSRGATLRKALRNVAPPLHAAAVERLASWRDKVAEIADVSPQWVVPDKLLARAAAASTSAEARAALGEVLELDLVVDPDVEHALTGDALQVARQSHLTETSLAELLEHLSAARQVHHVPDECSETSCARWWLPFSSAAAFREAVSRKTSGKPPTPRSQ
ncbi:CRK3, partial [Symbiodinium sp. CCMP2592]